MKTGFDRWVEGKGPDFQRKVDAARRAEVEARLEALGKAQGALTPFGLRPLSRKGGPVAVFRLAADHLDALHGRVAEEETRILGLVRTRSNTVEDNRRWSETVIQAIEASRVVRTYVSAYLAWLGEEEKPRDEDEDR